MQSALHHPAARPVRGILAILLLALTFSASRAAEDPHCPPPPSAPVAQASSVDHGLLWRVRRDGHDSYLYGTLHVGRAAWSLPGPQELEAWRATEVLALELDISDPATLKALTQEAPRLAQPLNAKLQSRLDAQVRAACLPDGALAPLHPLMQISTLSVLAGRWDDLDTGYAQEAVLLGMAQHEARKVVALETAQEQLTALIPKDAKEVQRNIADGLEQLEKNEVRAPMLKLAQAWADSDLELLQRYEQWCDCIHDEADRRYLHGLLETRNPRMAERIAVLHASGKRLFVGVGALHMTGPTGLPTLLRKMGFDVQALVPGD